MSTVAIQDSGSEMYNQVLNEIDALMNAMNDLDGQTNPAGMQNGDVNNLCQNLLALFGQLSGLYSEFKNDPSSMNPADRAWFEVPANRAAVQNFLNALNTPMDGQKGDPTFIDDIRGYENGTVNISQIKSDISILNQPGNETFQTLYQNYEYILKNL